MRPSRPRVRARRRIPLVLLLALLTLTNLAPACGDAAEPDPTPMPASSDGPRTSSPAPPSSAELSSFDSLTLLAEAMTNAGQPCTLEYEALRDTESEVSLCILATGQATLRIWDDPALVGELVASGTATGRTVYGANWTVDVRDPTVARTLADALGGQVAS